ncbi:DUF2065 domain-containing protein [Dinoroseobacter sp. S375]|uniref:DUF2065 domain-containing protein n=1 Tax=Dinoroseobacter sp. S375 TaxID=3415136 RepID=UPI003C7C8067
METLLTALGLVFVIEGLVFALAPSRIEDLLAAFARMPVTIRRGLGLGAIALGTILVWVGKSLAA